jgi:hypothetical protein
MAEVKSRPFKSPWGIHKTRCQLQSARLDKPLKFGKNGNPKISPMSMRFFNRILARFQESWK